MTPDPAPERQTFDFETNAWVAPDRFNTRATGREIVLDAPENPPALGRWHLPPPKQGTTPLQIALAWGMAALFIAGLAFHSLFPLAGTLVLFVALMLTGAAREAEALQMTDEDRRLLEDPDDRDVCLVVARVTRNGKTVGQDKGVAWFADGLLLFSGHHTSFALGGEDVLPRTKWDADTLGEHTVPLRVPNGTAEVTLTPLTDGKTVTPNEMRFLKNLYAFKRRPPTSKGSRQWPPFESV